MNDRNPAEIQLADQPPAPPSAPLPSWGERIFMGSGGLRSGWRLLLYVIMVAALGFLLRKAALPHRLGLGDMGKSMFGVTAALFMAVLPALFMAKIEKRSFWDYGISRRGAFGKLFWQGMAWGIAAITALLLVLRGVHAFYFGNILLHGASIWKFAISLAVFFVLVGFVEEFLLRGYTQFTLAQGIGFWPAGVLLSILFGAGHLGNPGESIFGAAAAGAVGLFFCLTLKRTGTLWFAIGFHASWDWGESYLYGVADSGSIFPGRLMNPSWHGPAWLTGGTVGPEGSLLAFLVIVALCALFARAYPAAQGDNSSAVA